MVSLLQETWATPATVAASGEVVLDKAEHAFDEFMSHTDGKRHKMEGDALTEGEAIVGSEKGEQLEEGKRTWRIIRTMKSKLHETSGKKKEKATQQKIDIIRRRRNQQIIEDLTAKKRSKESEVSNLFRVKEKLIEAQEAANTTLRNVSQELKRCQQIEWMHSMHMCVMRSYDRIQFALDRHSWSFVDNSKWGVLRRRRTTPEEKKAMHELNEGIKHATEAKEKLQEEISDATTTNAILNEEMVKVGEGLDKCLEQSDVSSIKGCIAKYVKE